MAQIPEEDAFTTSFLALGARPTPFSFDVWSSQDGCIGLLKLVAMRARDAVDVLGSPDTAVMLVTDVGHYEFIGDSGRTIDLASIAARRGISGVEFDIDWTHPVPGRSGEHNAIAISPRSLSSLLHELDHYEFETLELPSMPTADEVDGIALSLGTRDWKKPILPAIPGCDVFLSVHDDSFVHLEARRDGPIWNVSNRCLQLFLNEALRERWPDALPVTLSQGIVKELASRGRSWTIDRDHVDLNGRSLSLGFVAESWRVGEPVAASRDALVVCDLRDGTWGIS